MICFSWVPSGRDLGRDNMPVTFYPHQVRAIEWMKQVESRYRMVSDQCHGGILAHAMGLGKTTTMLGVIDQINQTQPTQTLVVCPKSVLQQWKEEALKVTSLEEDDVLMYHGQGRLERLEELSSKKLVLTTFDLVRLDHLSETGVSGHRWGRLVIDEAHHICETNSKTSLAVRSLQSPNRWCITGTPFKNNVADLIALAKFIGVAPYNRSTWWRLYSDNPKKIAEWRHTCVHWEEKHVMNLPSIHSRFQLCEPFAYESHLFSMVQSQVDAADLVTLCSGDQPQQKKLLKILRLRQLADHPLMLVSLRNAEKLLSGSCQDRVIGCQLCGGEVDCLNNDTCNHRVCSTCGQLDSSCPMCPLCLVSGVSNHMNWMHSSKTQALLSYVNEFPNDKMVVFSQWTTCLDLLSLMFLRMGIKCICFDGRVNSLEERGDIIRQFEQDDDCRILLTSLGAGGEGLNLICATHVVLMEPYWNLAVEQQALDRVHRIGQTRDVHVLRLVSAGVEDWVVDIQKWKQQELERLLLGVEPEEGLARKRSRGGRRTKGSKVKPVDALLDVKMQFSYSSGKKRGSGGLMKFSKRVKTQ